jgi:hypothetical protein
VTYCEDGALFFESPVPVDQVEPELVLESSPVVDDIVIVTVLEEIIVHGGWVCLTGHRWLHPVVRAPPELRL